MAQSQRAMKGYNYKFIEPVTDPDYLGLEVFGNPDDVFAHLRELKSLGWVYTSIGLMVDNGDGPIVARPIKRSDQTQFTGVMYFKAPNYIEM